MPLYEYHCEHCDGIFELLRKVRESSDPQPCPECDRDSKRLMPTEFNAFVMRGGMPRRIPDQGLYWSLKGQTTEPERGQNMDDVAVAYQKPRSESATVSGAELGQAAPNEPEVRLRKKRTVTATAGGGGGARPKATKATTATKRARTKQAAAKKTTRARKR